MQKYYLSLQYLYEELSLLQGLNILKGFTYILCNSLVLQMKTASMSNYITFLLKTFFHIIYTKFWKSHILF